MTLLVSGGHTMLVLVLNVNEYRIVGSTLDDSVGEAVNIIVYMPPLFSTL